MESRVSFDDLAGDLDADAVTSVAESIRKEHGESFLEAAAGLGAAAEGYSRKSCQPAVYKCERCNGTGRRLGGVCFRCDGSGKQKRKPVDHSAAAVAKRIAVKDRKEERTQAERNSYMTQHARVFDWLHSKSSNHTFAASLLNGFARFGHLTDGQITAVQNAIVEDERRAEERRCEQERRAAQPAPTVGPDAIDLSPIPEGRYAVPDGDTRLKIMIKKPDSGKWADWIFVSDAAAYGQQQKYGAQRPGEKYRGKVQDALRAILSNPKAAAVAYGRLTGTCCICGAKLENEASVEAGIGPICAGKF